MSSFLENVQLGCGVCRILCYMFYRKLCCKPAPKPRPEFSPICIGLTGVGKTTLLTQLAGESSDGIEPTSGFNIKAVQFKDCILNVKEIGGSEKVRPFWKHYFKDAQGVIFVVDSACSEEELDITGTELHGALCNPILAGLPCLVLANCQDKQGARNVQQLESELDLEAACEGRRWAIHACSTRDMQDIREGFYKLNAFLLAPSGGEEQTEDAASKSVDSSTEPGNYNRI